MKFVEYEYRMTLFTQRNSLVLSPWVDIVLSSWHYNENYHLFVFVEKGTKNTYFVYEDSIKEIDLWAIVYKANDIDYIIYDMKIISTNYDGQIFIDYDRHNEFIENCKKHFDMDVMVDD